MKLTRSRWIAVLVVWLIISSTIALLGGASLAMRLLYLFVATVAYGGAALGMIFLPRQWVVPLSIASAILGALILDLAAMSIWPNRSFGDGAYYLYPAAVSAVGVAVVLTLIVSNLLSRLDRRNETRISNAKTLD